MNMKKPIKNSKEIKAMLDEILAIAESIKKIATKEVLKQARKGKGFQRCNCGRSGYPKGCICARKAKKGKP